MQKETENIYEAVAADTAMLKPSCPDTPSPVEKPCRDGLNFLKMSV